MGMRFTNTLALLAALLWVCVSADAQPPAGPTADELRRQIQQLSEADRDESLPAEVRALNRRFILERRKQLRALLQQKVDALQKYQAAVAASLTAEEKQAIQNSLAAAQNDVQALDKELQNAPDTAPDAAGLSGATLSAQPAATPAQAGVTAMPETPLRPKPPPLSTAEAEKLAAARGGANTQ